jgi:hypothetical protein
MGKSVAQGEGVMKRLEAGGLILGASSLVIAASLASAQNGTAAEQAYMTPRTSWGDPDLAGIYSNDDETGTPMERPDEFEGLTLATITPEKIAQIVAERDRRFKAQVDGEAWRRSISPPPHLIFDTFDRNNTRPWLITDPEDGKIPARTAEADARPRIGGVSTNQNSRGPFNSYTDMGLYDRPHVSQSVKQYLGDARGFWDGDTLVVETTNFRAETAPQRSSENVKMIERFKRTSADTVEWTVTFEDPTTWVRPWTFSMPHAQVDHTQRIYEYACHEGNLAMRNILSGARAAEAAAQ